tara:strand:- start:9442 stop:9609 length:168 start_codon:yes stop_codon:yes gene_type:complete
MRYFTSSTKQRLNLIINKLNRNEEVSLAERILLNKYLTKIPYLSSLIKERSIKFS